MERRSFLKSSAVAAGAVVSGSLAHAAASPERKTVAGKHNFKLKYAPHFGMFKHSAGDDLLDQMQFMADAGFTAMEDNGMKGREGPCRKKLPARWPTWAWKWEFLLPIPSTGRNPI